MRLTCQMDVFSRSNVRNAGSGWPAFVGSVSRFAYAVIAPVSGSSVHNWLAGAEDCGLQERGWKMRTWRSGSMPTSKQAGLALVGRDAANCRLTTRCRRAALDAVMGSDGRNGVWTAETQ